MKTSVPNGVSRHQNASSQNSLMIALNGAAFGLNSWLMTVSNSRERSEMKFLRKIA